MNLGGVYLDTMYEIAAYAFLATACIAVFVRYRFRIRKRVLIPSSIIAFLAVAYVCEVAFHQDLFAHRHRAQNDRIPDIVYSRYRPDFGLLRAVGPMSEAELERWLAANPELKLTEAEDLSFVAYDLEWFKVPHFDRHFATPMSGRGGQYRVYWKADQVYIAYRAF